MDLGKYDEAAVEMERLVNGKNGIVGIHKQMLNADLLFCELVGDNRPEKIAELYNDELKKFLKMAKKSPSTFRTQYLYAKYVEKDEKAVAAALNGFEKVAKTYPYPHEVEAERELIAYAEEKLTN